MTTKQAPINSGFGAKSAAQEVLGGRDLRGKVAIVTGGYSGIGLETTRVLAGAGATVIVPARTKEKAQKALAGMQGVELGEMELSDPASIDAFAKAFVDSGRPLHMLINNAGVMACPLERDSRGFERQLAVNHLGHFQLTSRLWPALLKARGARVVSVSSRGHRRSAVDFADPHFNVRPYDRWLAYGQSKSANVLFAVALDKRGEPHGIRAFSLHPGGIITDLIRHMSDAELQSMGVRDENGQPKENPEFKSIPQGAATQVWCATSEQLNGMGGVYCEDVDIAKAVAADDPGGTGVRPWAIDPDLAEKLWKLSESWI
jgi:NAD(P)-dependent dehydrogenase (short-subunit alcohol dehydrogenase family)